MTRRSRVVDYGMGNRRSVQKALEHVGATVAVTRDHDELRARDGLVVPGVGAFPIAMRNLRELGLDELIREPSGRGTPLLGICLGMQLLFERSVELEPAEGLGLVPGEVTPACEPAGCGFRTSAGTRCRSQRPSPLTEGLPVGGLSLLPRALVRGAARRRRGRRRHHRVRRAVRHDRRRAARCSASSSTPRSPRRTGCAMLANFVGAVRATGRRRRRRSGGARMILIPAIDILDGKAVRLALGEFDSETVYDADPLDAARRWVADGARALHVVDLDGARSGAAGQPRARPEDRRRGRRPGAGRRRAADDRRRPSRDRGRRYPSRARHCRVHATSTSSTRRSREYGDRVIVSVDARNGQLAASRLDRADRDSGRSP